MAPYSSAEFKDSFALGHSALWFSCLVWNCSSGTVDTGTNLASNSSLI